MQRFISILFMIPFLLTVYAQKINESGQKVIKEIVVYTIKENGERSPKEQFIYNYDINLRLNGIIRRENINYPDSDEPSWTVRDSIRLINGKIQRNSYLYDRKKNISTPDDYTYIYTLDNNRCITQIVRVSTYENGSITKFIDNYSYNDIIDNGRPTLVKRDWVEWWYPIDDKQWYRQGRPAVTVYDYGYGIWAYRKVDETPEEALRQQQTFIDYDAPDNLNIDISGLMSDYYFFDPDFRSESMTEWMPRRLSYFPKDRISLNKFAPYEYDTDDNGSIVRIKGNWLEAKESILKNNFLIELKYL